MIVIVIVIRPMPIITVTVIKHKYVETWKVIPACATQLFCLTQIHYLKQ